MDRSVNEHDNRSVNENVNRDVNGHVNEQISATRTLLKLGADRLIADVNERTPLDIAKASGNAALIRVFAAIK